MDLQGAAMCSHTQKHQVRIQKGMDLAPKLICCKKRDAPICWVRDGRFKGLRPSVGFAMEDSGGYAHLLGLQWKTQGVARTTAFWIRDAHRRRQVRIRCPRKACTRAGIGVEEACLSTTRGSWMVRRTTTVLSRLGSPGMAQAGGQPTRVGGHGFRHGIGDRRRSKGQRRSDPPTLTPCLTSSMVVRRKIDNQICAPTTIMSTSLMRRRVCTTCMNGMFQLIHSSMQTWKSTTTTLVNFLPSLK